MAVPRRARVWLVVGSCVLAVILAITLYYVFNGIGSRTLARDELIGIWANEETGATVEFTSDERAQVRNFTRIPSLTTEPVPGLDLNGRWYLYEGDVAISLDEQIEGSDSVSFDTATCGVRACLIYGSEDDHLYEFFKAEG